MPRPTDALRAYIDQMQSYRWDVNGEARHLREIADAIDAEFAAATNPSRVCMGRTVAEERAELALMAAYHRGYEDGRRHGA